MANALLNIERIMGKVMVGRRLWFFARLMATATRKRL